MLSFFGIEEWAEEIMAKSKQTWSGIDPKTLLGQIRNTVPFLFEEASPRSGKPEQRYFDVLDAIAAQEASGPFDHLRYYEFCLVAHFTSVGGFVPTDVDNQIRKKIWQTSPNLDMSLEMAKLAMEMGGWDILPVCGKFVRSTTQESYISGLEGEWLGVAAAAYGALRKRAPERAQDFLLAIERVLKKEERIFSELLGAQKNLDVLRAATLIAHNLGDLDRVMDLWDLPKEDPLKKRFYKLGHEANPEFGEAFLFAGALNKKHLAAENHRNFPLREPRALRQKKEYLLPVSPFLDDWGALLARDRDLEGRDLSEIITALIKGLERVPGSIAYGRALAGMASAFPNGFREFAKFLPVKLAKELEAGPVRSLASISRERFENEWAGFVGKMHHSVFPEVRIL
jgi:hypothetical protein